MKRKMVFLFAAAVFIMVLFAGCKEYACSNYPEAAAAAGIDCNCDEGSGGTGD